MMTLYEQAYRESTQDNVSLEGDSVMDNLLVHP